MKKYSEDESWCLFKEKTDVIGVLFGRSLSCFCTGAYKLKDQLGYPAASPKFQFDRIPYRIEVLVN